MKVLHINTHDSGGAFEAGYRIHQELQKNIESKFLVLKSSFRNDVISYLPTSGYYKRLKESIFFRYYNYRLMHLKKRIPENAGTLSLPYSAFDVTATKEYAEADIIHLHWVAGFLHFPTLFKKKDKKIVWTLHDLNPIGGFFHFGSLIELPGKVMELNKYIQSKKNELTEGKVDRYIAPSKWILSEFAKAKGYTTNCVHINNGIDPDIIDSSRRGTNKSSGKIIVIFIAQSLDDPYKGFSFLLESFRYLDLNMVKFIAIGKPPFDRKNDLKIEYTGYIHDHSEIYQYLLNADIFVIPSLADNLPNTVLEAMACGLPVVSFDTGGIPEMVKNEETGLIAQNGNSFDLASKIMTLVNDKEKRERLGENALKLIRNEYNIKLQADKYRELYKIIS